MPKPRRNEFPDFSGQAASMQKAFRAMPRVVGNTAVNFYKDRFRRGGWQDVRFQPWTPRKRHHKRKRALLVRTGRLRRSIRIVRISSDSVVVGTDVPYARIHNEGGRISTTQNVRAHLRRGRPVRAHSRRVNATIPQRQFIGASRLLTRRLVAVLNEMLARSMK